LGGGERGNRKVPGKEPRCFSSPRGRRAGKRKPHENAFEAGSRTTTTTTTTTAAAAAAAAASGNGRETTEGGKRHAGTDKRANRYSKPAKGGHAAGHSRIGPLITKAEALDATPQRRLSRRSNRSERKEKEEGIEGERDERRSAMAFLSSPPRRSPDEV